MTVANGFDGTLESRLDASLARMDGDPDLTRLADELLDRLDELADRAADEILDAVPGYRSGGPLLAGAVRAHVLAHFTMVVDSFGSSTSITPGDLEYTRLPATQRIAQVSFTEFMQAFRIGEIVIWDGVCDIVADDPALVPAALQFASHGILLGGLASSIAAERYAEAERLLELTGERIRRDLLEELLNGDAPAPGPRLDAAQAAGLSAELPLVVTTATPVGQHPDEHQLRAAATAIAGALTVGVDQPLAVIRNEEIVVVSSCPQEDGGAALAADLPRVQEARAQEGLVLAIGVSTVQMGLSSVADAYREACAARQQSVDLGGVVALPGLSAFEYLTLQTNGTARRLVPANVASFLEHDAEEGGTLVDTLRQYVASDLNVTATAERMHLHVNTARYRLRKIADATGRDLRRISDLMDLLLAVSLHRETHPPAEAEEPLDS